MIPAGHRLLFSDLRAKIDAATDEEGVARATGQILRSLLRRKGDAEFLLVVQDLVTDSVAGRPLAEQKRLAAEVVGVVLDKRPEIAAAWQALHRAEAAPAHRRAADHAAAPEADDLPPIDLPPIDLPGEEVAPPPPYEFARAEALVGRYVADVLARRLAIFRVGEPRFPGLAYRHDRPFFLFDPAFAEVARRFVVEVVMPHCRDALQRRVYQALPPRVRAESEGLAAFLAEKRPETWKILIERLTKWAGHHRTAEAKLAAAESGAVVEGEEFAEVEVPVSTPRVFTVLGVEFALGSRVTKRRMRVRVKATTEPNADELEALDMVARLHSLAAEAGMELPVGCDFLFLRTLLEFDARKYAGAVREFTALASQEETSPQYLLERLKYVDETYPNTLSDVLLLILFHDAGHFGFQEIYNACIGTSLDKSARASKRPFLQEEVGRRPRELAFQIREVLRRRYDERTLALAVRMLVTVWRIMGRQTFRHELEAALGVFAAFPVAFAGDPDEPVFSHVGHILHRALSAAEPDVAATVEAVNDVYAPVARRLRAAVTQRPYSAGAT